MAQADRDRRFYGTIKRETDSDGHPFVYGKIMVRDGFLIAMAACQDDLGTRLDELTLMSLDYGLHLDSGATFTICEFTFFSN